jgi:hypothetical protein
VRRNETRSNLPTDHVVLFSVFSFLYLYLLEHEAHFVRPTVV